MIEGEERALHDGQASPRQIRMNEAEFSVLWENKKVIIEATFMMNSIYEIVHVEHPSRSSPPCQAMINS